MRLVTVYQHLTEWRKIGARDAIEEKAAKVAGLLKIGSSLIQSVKKGSLGILWLWVQL